MAKETSVKETTPAVSPPETKANPPTSLFGKFYPTDPHSPKTVHSRPPPPPQLFLTGNFSNDDCDGSENVKKANFAREHAFLYIVLPSLNDYGVKIPNFTFYGGRKQAATNFSLPSKT